MRLLDVANQCCYRTGDNTLKALFSTDDNAKAWLGYLQQAGRLISKEHPWEVLQREAVVITSGNKREYDLPEDFMDIQTYQIYNITNNRIIMAETNDEALSKIARKDKSQSTIRFRIMGGKIVFTYPIDDGIELRYVYLTNSICKNNDTGVYSDVFTTDDDRFLMKDELLILKAMALRAVDLGLPEVQQREADYQKMLDLEMNSDGANVKFNKYNLGFFNKTTPSEWSVNDRP